MKLSLSNCGANEYLAFGETKRSTLAALRACGFTHVDVEILAEDVAERAEEHAMELRALLAELELTASTAHAPCINPVKHPEQALFHMIHALRFCKTAGIPVVVMHPGAVKGNTREEFFESNAAFFRLLIPHVEETGVTVAIENIGNYDDPYFLWNGFDLRDLIDRVDHPLIAACWDIGHANHFFQKDCEQYRSIVALGEKLVAIHAHDNCGYIADSYKHARMDLHTMPYFAHPASVNWDAVLQGLKDVGYRGTFNFEVNAGVSSECEDFVHNGKLLNTLKRPSLKTWQAVNTALYAIGCEMLQAYGMLEE